MDPSVCLEEIRLLISEIDRGLDSGNNVVEAQAMIAAQIADKFEALDKWIMKGGVLPKSWLEKGRPF